MLFTEHNLERIDKPIFTRLRLRLLSMSTDMVVVAQKRKDGPALTDKETQLMVLSAKHPVIKLNIKLLCQVRPPQPQYNSYVHRPLREQTGCL